jgi:glycosyltransferase involved in cell wall biosynthesis
MHDTATNLVDEGWGVHVVTAPPAFPHGQFDRTMTRKTTTERDGVTVHELWTWQPTTDDPGFVSRLAYHLGFSVHAALWLLVHGRKYDVAFTTSPPIFTGLGGLVSKAVHRTPWVVDVRDLWIDAAVDLGFVTEGTVVERASRTFERLVLKTADLITVTTETLEAKLPQQYGISDRKIAHVPNGVDTDVFSSSEDDVDPVVVYTGNVGHGQDLEACVRAMARLDRDNVELVVVGDGDARAELQRLTRKLGIEDAVEFHGTVPRERVPEYLDRAAIGVAPLKDTEALDYAIPTKVYEYMACELPIVATGTGEIERVIEDTGTGVVADNDPDEIADVILELLADEQKRFTMGRNGRRYVLDKYERSSIARRLSERLRAKLDE